MSESQAKLPADVWVVVPAYNEAARLGNTLQDLLTVAQTVVVVDDGSKDDTYDVASQYPVWVLRHVVNLGAGAATQTGITFSLKGGARFIATFDADGQHDPADLPVLYRVLQERNADVVLGSRFVGEAIGMPRARRLMLRVASAAAYFLCGVWVTDVTTGLRLFNRRAAQSVHIKMNRFEHPIDLLQQIARYRLRLVEAPARIRYSADSLRKGQRTWGVFRLGLKLLAEELLQ